jgi:hypothetical protein
MMGISEKHIRASAFTGVPNGRGDDGATTELQLIPIAGISDRLSGVSRGLHDFKCGVLDDEVRC